MANVVIPEQHKADYKGVSKVDYTDHQRDPGYQKAVAAGQRNLRKMKFEDRGEEERYIKAVKSHPANTFGLPAFFPPLQVAPSFGFGEGKETDVMPCEHKWCRLSENGVYSCKYGHQFIKNSEGTTQWSALS